MITDQKNILEAFLKEKFREKEWDIDEGTISLINANIELATAEPDESEETRTVSLKQDAAGKVTASSFKLYNITQVSIRDLLGVAMKEAGALFIEDTKVKIVYALLMLLYDFIPELKVKFIEQTAQVLWAINRMQKNEFETQEIKKTYENVFHKKLSPGKLTASLDELVTLKVLRQKAPDVYQVKEKIKNLSR